MTMVSVFLYFCILRIRRQMAIDNTSVYFLASTRYTFYPTCVQNQQFPQLRRSLFFGKHFSLALMRTIYPVNLSFLTARRDTKV